MEAEIFHQQLSQRELKKLFLMSEDQAGLGSPWDRKPGTVGPSGMIWAPHLISGQENWGPGGGLTQGHLEPEPEALGDGKGPGWESKPQDLNSALLFRCVTLGKSLSL